MGEPSKSPGEMNNVMYAAGKYAYRLYNIQYRTLRPPNCLWLRLFTGPQWVFLRDHAWDKSTEEAIPGAGGDNWPGLSQAWLPVEQLGTDYSAAISKYPPTHTHTHTYTYMYTCVRILYVVGSTWIFLILSEVCPSVNTRRLVVVDLTCSSALMTKAICYRDCQSSGCLRWTDSHLSMPIFSLHIQCSRCYCCASPLYCL